MTRTELRKRFRLVQISANAWEVRDTISHAPAERIVSPGAVPYRRAGQIRRNEIERAYERK